MSRPDIGGKTIFIATQEKAMAEQLKEIAKLHYGLIHQKNNLSLTSMLKIYAEKEWFHKFIKDRKISIHKPEAISMNYVSAFNEEDLSHIERSYQHEE